MKWRFHFSCWLCWPQFNAVSFSVRDKDFTVATTTPQTSALPQFAFLPLTLTLSLAIYPFLSFTPAAVAQSLSDCDVAEPVDRVAFVSLAFFIHSFLLRLHLMHFFVALLFSFRAFSSLSLATLFRWAESKILKWLGRHIVYLKYFH